MPRIILKYIYSTILVALTASLCACHDSLLYDPDEQIVGEGIASVRLTASFRPVEETNLSRSADDLMDNVNNLSVLIYDLSGSLIDGGFHYFEKGVDFSTSTAAALDGAPTQRATISDPINIPYGKYRIYAVANAGNLNLEHHDEIQNENTFRTISVPWQAANIGDNSQMSGWFHVDSGNSGTHAATDAGYPSSYSNQLSNVATVTINGNKTLHAWLRRLSAKVTVDYDASGINDNVWIYIRSVRIRNIADECQLVANNAIDPVEADKNRPETDPHDPANDITDGEVHFYESHEAAVYANDPDDYSNYAKWPCVAKGNPYFGSHTPTTSENPDIAPFSALYAFENLQGEGQKDKKQVVIDNDINNLDYTWRDDMPAGTFIEVDGYYVSNSESLEGSGPIRYRFMLGKDITTNYDFERNFHYKLTLVFHGQANNVDWHIDYREEEKPGLYAPDPYYVSHVYNSVMEYPIRIEGQILSDYIDVTIVKNDWRPYDEKVKDYPADKVGDWEWIGKNYVAAGEDPTDPDFHGKAVWNGFLSLYDTTSRSEISKTGDAKDDYNKRDWYRIPNDFYLSYDGMPFDVESYGDRAFDVTCTIGGTQTTYTDVTKDEGYRRYKVPKTDGTFYFNTADGLDASKHYGQYRVVKKGSVTTLYIPLYTRPLIITTATSYTGNNPYYSYFRKAEINIHTVIKDLDGTPIDINRKKNVLQVRRLINPTVVMRRHDNTNCFNVQLLARDGEEYSNHFEAFRSRGPWSASIVAGSGWEIVGHSTGRTESFITFTVRPTEKIDPDEIRCAIVDVWYNNNSCRHRILLRQGYAPIDMEATRQAHDEVPYLEDNVLWHSFNLWWNDADGPRLTDCPLDAGSLFRKKVNYADPIDAINNNFSSNSTISDYGKGGRYNSSGTSRNEETGYFWLSPIKNNVRKTWDEIGCTTGVTFNELSLYGATVRPPKNSEWQCFVNNPNIDIAYGIAYGDGAYTVQSVPDNANRHSYVPKMPDNASTQTYKLGDFNLVGQDLKGEYGTRVCAVYNQNSVNCPILVLPIGQSGYGRRTEYRQWQRTAKGELRYAQRFQPMSDSDALHAYQPILHSIYTNYGAIYWAHEKTSGVMGWDINFSTFDFNSFNFAQFDACCVRFVQPKSGAGSTTITKTNPCWDYNQTEKNTRPGY